MSQVTIANGDDSVTQVVDTVSGYPEIIFWRDQYLCKTVSANNKAELCSVTFANP